MSETTVRERAEAFVAERPHGVDATGLLIFATHENAHLESQLASTREALKNLLDCLDQVEKDSMYVWGFVAIHGCPYKGRNWKAEYKAGRSALDRINQQQEK